ncbi:MAG: hypothetical protein U0931_18120 [Vulcanimicrobiota bacterium]
MSFLIPSLAYFFWPILGAIVIFLAGLAFGFGLGRATAASAVGREPELPRFKPHDR